MVFIDGIYGILLFEGDLYYNNNTTFRSEQLTVLVHRRLKTLVEPARPALVSVRFVNGTPAFEFALCLARVYPVPVDAPFEKPRTACRNTIIRISFPRFRFGILNGLTPGRSYRHNCKCRSAFRNSYPHKLCTGCPITDLL